jgi:gluconolactonase
MRREDFPEASEEDRKKYVVRAYEEIPLTELTTGAFSHLLRGKNILVSLLTMKAGSVFELHSHPQEQIMIVIEGYCDEIIDGKIYRVEKGDVLYLPPNVVHGAFIGDVDCKVIDIFSPVREDYIQKYLEQHPDAKVFFI